MSSKTNKVGRPVIGDASVTIRVTQEDLETVGTIARDLEALVHLKQTRAEVLRGALAHGLKTMRADLDAKLKASQG